MHGRQENLAALRCNDAAAIVSRGGRVATGNGGTRYGQRKPGREFHAASEFTATDNEGAIDRNSPLPLTDPSGGRGRVSTGRKGRAETGQRALDREN